MPVKIHTYLKGVGTGYMSMVATSLVGLALTPFILNHISKEEYAIYYIAVDILIWLGIVQLGVAPSFTSTAGHLIGANDMENLPRIAGTAWALQLLSALLIVIVGFVISFFLNHWFKPEQQIAELEAMFMILVLTTALTLSVQIYSGILIANKQIHIDNLIRILTLIPSIILTIIFLKSGFKLLGLALTGLITAVINLTINISRVKYQFPKLKLSIKLFNKADAKSLLSKGVWFSLGGVAGILILNLDKVIIGKFVSLAIVTSFIITYKLYALADKILGQVINVSRPYIAQIFGKKDFKKLYEIYFLLTMFSLLTGGLASSIIFFTNKYFITWWVGEEFYIGDEINLLLAVNFLLQFAVLPNRALLASTFFKIKEHNITRIVEGLLNLLLSLVLVHYFAVHGVIFASITATIILSNIQLNRFCNQIFETQNISIDWKMYLPYLVVLLPVLIYVIHWAFPAISVVASVFVISSTGIWFSYILWRAFNNTVANPDMLSFFRNKK